MKDHIVSGKEYQALHNVAYAAKSYVIARASGDDIYGEVLSLKALQAALTELDKVRR